MKTRISAIIIDSEADKHNYTCINDINNYRDGQYYFDYYFDLIILKNDENILQTLHENRGVFAIITVGYKSYENLFKLQNLPFLYRKMWSHINEFDRDKISELITENFKYNLNRISDCKLVSIFTCAYKTTKEQATRLYNSLLRQTYDNWNWWIIDDSDDNEETEFEKFNDPRITIFKNVTNHGNIGFNKHMIASMCDGDYLLEVDHDDELTPDCLEHIIGAFNKYPDSDFIYSQSMEEMDGEAVVYDGVFSLGLGVNEYMDVNGEQRLISLTPDINTLSMRHIVSCPNHIRCWKKEFYHRIGGHNTQLYVMDDFDILIRTYLNTKICKIDKVLYIQHEGSAKDNPRGTTTQAKRMEDILVLGRLIKEVYDKQIHEHALKNNLPDPCWNEEGGYGYIWAYIWTPLILQQLINENYIYEV